MSTNCSSHEVCNVCHRKFRRADLFNQHRLTCVDSSDEQFTPSFVTDNSESFDQVVPSNGNELVNDNELNFENQSPMSQGLLNDIEDNHILNEANESNNNSNTLNRTQYWKNDKQIGRKTKSHTVFIIVFTNEKPSYT